MTATVTRSHDRPASAAAELNDGAARVAMGVKLMPATGSERSGDFVTVCDRPDGTRAVVLVDVAGRGDVAHHFADGAQWLATTTASTPAGPAELLELLNASIHRLYVPGSVIASATAVVVDPHQHIIKWASAHQPGPWLLDTGDQLDGPSSDVMLGVSEVGGYQEGSAPLRPGGGVLLVTDGVLNAQGPDGEPFGPARLRHALCALAGTSAACTASELLRAVCHFAGHHLNDDAAAVALRVL